MFNNYSMTNLVYFLNITPLRFIKTSMPAIAWFRLRNLTLQKYVTSKYINARVEQFCGNFDEWTAYIFDNYICNFTPIAKVELH